MFKSEKDQYLPTDLLSNYREYLKSQNYSTPTVKNYLTDLRHLILWVKQNFAQFELSQINEASLRSYYAHLNERFAGTPSIVARRLSSLRKFLAWAADKGFVSADLVRAASSLLESSQKFQFPPTPIQIVAPTATTEPGPNISSYNLYQKVIHHIKNTRPSWYQRYHQKEWASTLHTVIMVLFIITVGSLFLYTEFIRPQLEQTRSSINAQLGDVLAAASPPSVLSFQGRLTNSSGVPISTSTKLVFRIYTAETGGTLKWTSKDWTLTPDQNGIFSVCLGNQTTTDDCLVDGVADTAIPSDLFTDNAALYLEIDVHNPPAAGGETLSPRQRIASVSYALNSDALEGFHGSQSPGANQVPILDSSGNLIFAGAATIGTGGGGAFTIDSASGTLTFGAGTNTLVNADAATVLLLNPTGDLQFQSGSNYITSAGNLVVGGTFTASGTSATFGSGGNTYTFDTSSGPSYAGTARIQRTWTIEPEYPGASLSVDDGTNNTGNITSDVDTSNWRNYYEWNSGSGTLQDYSIILRVTLPSDFSAWQTSNAIQLNFVTETTSTSNNAVSVRINNEDDTPGTAVVTVSDSASAVAATWTTITIDDSQIDEGSAPDWDAAGERAVIRIKLKSTSNNYARIGDVVLKYLAKF